MSRSAAFSTRPDGPVGAPQLVDEERRELDRCRGSRTSSSRRRRRGLPTRCPPSPRISRQRRRRVARLARQAQVLEADEPHRQRCGLGEPEALVADEERRIAGSADDQHRLLEPRVEPSEVGEVGAVLAIAPHDDMVVAVRLHPCSKAVEPIGVDRGRHQRLGRRHAEVGKLDLGQPGRASSCRHRSLSSGIHRVGRPVRRRSIVTNWSAAQRHPRSHLAVWPLHADLGIDGLAEADMNPAELPAGVPAADRDLAGHRRSPTRTSTHAPIASTFGAGCCRRMASQWPIGSGCSASPRPTFRHRSTGAARLTTTRSSKPSRFRSTSAAPRARSKLDDSGRLRAVDERAVGLADATGCSGRGWRTRAVPRRCPW